MEQSISKRPELTGTALRVMAMVFMLMDHLWATLLPGQEWLTCVGRLAFPIFAFLTVEGYFHTRNFKKYMLRMLAFAVISEIPFDWMSGGSWFYPFHQNVIWTMMLGLLAISLLERARAGKRRWLCLLESVVIVIAAVMLGTVCMVDYYGPGVLTLLVFYVFRQRKWWCLLGQILGLYWINVQMLQGLFYEVSVFGLELSLSQQGLALLALIPIWLYHGRQGYHSKPFQYACYAFYPAHMLLLCGILALYNQIH